MGQLKDRVCDLIWELQNEILLFLSLWMRLFIIYILNERGISIWRKTGF